MRDIFQDPREQFVFSTVQALLCLVCLLLSLPVFGQSTVCAPISTTPQGVSHSILVGDSVVSPWSNETPVGLRSSEIIDGRLAMRVDLAQWAPIAFDSYGQVLTEDFDVFEFTIRSSVDNPSVNIISSSGVVCSLTDFVVLEKDRWTLVQVPLASLGLVDQLNIGRLKIKSTIEGLFTLWMTDVKLRAAVATTSPQVIPTAPSVGQCFQRPTPPQFVAWHRDPGVSGEIDDHLSVNVITLEANGQDLIDDSPSFKAALESIPDGGIVQIPAGTYYLSDSIELKHDNQVLRGAGRDRTRLVFTRPLAYGIAILGADGGVETAINEGNYGSTRLLMDPVQASYIGMYGVLINTSSQHSQVVSIIGQRPLEGQTELVLSKPLNSHFDAGAYIKIFDANEFSGVEALSVDVESIDIHVGDMFFFRGAAHGWLRDVESRMAREAHVFTRQTYSCEITGNTILDATGHGDGKQGYGIDLANSTTGCLVENNILGYLRHSILLNNSANANVIAFNHSFSPRHPNFFPGGPGDISFHGFSYANLVEGNVVERIHMGDSGEIGGGNLIHRNCLTSGPLTVGNSPNAVQSLYTNAMYGSNAELMARQMPAVLPQTTEPQPYLQPGNTIFDDDGVRVESIALAPTLVGNWYRGIQDQVAPQTPGSYYGTRFSPLLREAATDNWMADCRIPAYVNAEVYKLD